MGSHGGEPYAYREVNQALQRYVDSNPPANEIPFVLAFLKELLCNPTFEGVVLELEDGEVGFFKDVPKTQTYVTWTRDDDNRDIVVYRIEALRSVLGT